MRKKTENLYTPHIYSITSLQMPRDSNPYRYDSQRTGVALSPGMEAMWNSHENRPLSKEKAFKLTNNVSGQVFSIIMRKHKHDSQFGKLILAGKGTNEVIHAKAAPGTITEGGRFKAIFMAREGFERAQACAEFLSRINPIGMQFEADLFQINPMTGQPNTVEAFTSPTRPHHLYLVRLTKAEFGKLNHQGKVVYQRGWTYEVFEYPKNRVLIARQYLRHFDVIINK